MYRLSLFLKDSEVHAIKIFSPIQSYWDKEETQNQVDNILAVEWTWILEHKARILLPLNKYEIAAKEMY